jgi:hypothetical protein
MALSIHCVSGVLGVHKKAATTYTGPSSNSFRGWYFVNLYQAQVICGVRWHYPTTEREHRPHHNERELV